MNHKPIAFEGGEDWQCLHRNAAALAGPIETGIHLQGFGEGTSGRNRWVVIWYSAWMMVIHVDWFRLTYGTLPHVFAQTSIAAHRWKQIRALKRRELAP